VDDETHLGMHYTVSEGVKWEDIQWAVKLSSVRDDGRANSCSCTEAKVACKISLSQQE